MMLRSRLWQILALLLMLACYCAPALVILDPTRKTSLAPFIVILILIPPMAFATWRMAVNRQQEIQQDEHHGRR